MADGFTMVIKGQAALDRKMRALDRRVKGKLTRKAVKAGADVIKHGAEENAETMVGGEMGTLLAQRLGTKRFRKQKRGSYGVALRIRPGPLEFIWITQDGTRQYVPAAIEFGHVSRDGSRVPAIPYMRAAFDTKVRPAIVAIGNVLKIGVEIRNP